MQSLINERKTSCFNSGDEIPNTSEHIWLIVNGVVKTFTISESGTLITLGFWGEQDLIGQPLSCIEPYFLKCMSNVQLSMIPRSQWSNCSRDFFYHGQQTQQLLFIIRNTRIAKRLWLLLQWLSSKFGRVVEQGTIIDFKLTHQELADAIGTTRITVTKILNQFEREGLIVRPKTKCIILKR